MDEQLKNYQLQLQQVQIALFANPDSTELQKLKNDLDEVIDLTLQLHNKPDEATAQSEYPATTICNGVDDDEITRSLLAVEEFVTKTKKKKLYRVGELCLAKWSGNNQYYSARINSINPDGQANVTFEAYKSRGITSLSELKEYTGEKRQLSEAERMKRNKLNNREYVEQKKLKMTQRCKALDEEREADKNKWLAFKSKSAKMNKMGLNRRSIFASTDFVNGRVGIGTCGTSGKPMTDFSTHKDNNGRTCTFSLKL